jgi:hypothetical protein
VEPVFDGRAAAGVAHEVVTEVDSADFVAEPAFGDALADGRRWIVACEEAALHAA